MKKRIIVLSAVSCLTALCTLTAVVAIKSSGAKLDVVRGEPMLRTLTLNEAPTVVDGKFSVRTVSGTTINFTCSNFTPSGTFGSLKGEGNIDLKYDDADNDIMFSSLYSVTVNYDGYFYFDYRYYDPVQRRNVSTGNTGSFTSGVEVKASEHQVEVDDGGGSSHNEVPNHFQIYAVSGTHTISSIVIKYTC